MPTNPKSTTKAPARKAPAKTAAAKPAAKKAPAKAPARKAPAKAAAKVVEPAAVELPTTVPTTTVEVEVMELLAFEQLDRIVRLELMKAEVAATRAWVDGGRVGDKPARPVNNAYAAYVLDQGRAIKGNGTGERKSRSNFTTDALADVLARITALRADGKGWPTIAKTFNDEGVPTAKGGKWAASTVLGIAKRAGMPTKLDRS